MKLELAMCCLAAPSMSEWLRQYEFEEVWLPIKYHYVAIAAIFVNEKGEGLLLKIIHIL